MTPFAPACSCCWSFRFDAHVFFSTRVSRSFVCRQVFGSLLWDRLVTLVFAPQIIIIGHRDAWRALPTLRSLARTGALGLYWLLVFALWGATDSIFVPIAGWYFWAKNPAMLGLRGVPPPVVLPAAAAAAAAPPPPRTRE